MFAIGGVLLTCFTTWEHRYVLTREPLIDVQLFRLSSYTLGSLVALICFGGFTAIFCIALVSSIFYADFAPNPHQAACALERGLAVSIGFVLLAVMPALGDLMNHLGTDTDISLRDMNSKQ